MKKRWFLITALLTMLACILPMAPMDHTVQARRYERIVVCSDVHYGSKTLDPKNEEQGERGPGNQRMGRCGPLCIYGRYGPENRQLGRLQTGPETDGPCQEAQGIPSREP